METALLFLFSSILYSHLESRGIQLYNPKRIILKVHPQVGMRKRKRGIGNSLVPKLRNLFSNQCCPKVTPVFLSCKNVSSWMVSDIVQCFASSFIVWVV